MFFTRKKDIYKSAAYYKNISNLNSYKISKQTEMIKEKCINMIYKRINNSSKNGITYLELSESDLYDEMYVYIIKKFENEFKSFFEDRGFCLEIYDCPETRIKISW